MIQILGTFTPSATFSSGGYITTGSTINIGGAGSQTVPSVPGLTYNNLTISGSGTKTSNGNVSLTGNLNVLGSTVFDLATFAANRNVAGGTLTVANGATLRVGGTFPTNFQNVHFCNH